MAEWVKIENVTNVLNAMKALGGKADAAALAGVQALAVEFENRAKKNLLQVQNNGVFHIGSPGDFPNRRSGNLANSFVQEVRQGLGAYQATVGQTAVYARVLEFGGGRNWRGKEWPANVKYPYMSPTFYDLRLDADRVFVNAVARVWKA